MNKFSFLLILAFIAGSVFANKHNNRPGRESYAKSVVTYLGIRGALGCISTEVAFGTNFNNPSEGLILKFKVAKNLKHLVAQAGKRFPVIATVGIGAHAGQEYAKSLGVNTTLGALAGGQVASVFTDFSKDGVYRYYGVNSVRVYGLPGIVRTGALVAGANLYSKYNSK